MKRPLRQRLASWIGGEKRQDVRGTAFAAARGTRLMDDWYPSLLSADREIKSSLRTLRARSRQLYRDNPHATAFINLVKTNVVGPYGVTLQSKITQGNGDLRKRTNQNIEEAFLEWGEPETASVDGRLSWCDSQELAIATAALDGECLIRIRRGYANPFGFALQFLDADQLDESYSIAPTRGQNEIRMGVEIDADGRPVFYHLWPHHPAGTLPRGTRVRVPADEIIHLFVSLRPGQTRGIPWLTPVMLRLGLLDGLEEAELVASRDAAAKPVYFKVTPEGEDVWGDEKFMPDAPIVEDVEPGTAKQLPFGLEPIQMNPTHPTTAFAGFHKAILRTVAAGAGVAYVSLTGDLEAVNFGSQRGGLLLERDQWRRLQSWLVRQLHRRVFREWLTMAATSGAVQLPTLEVARWLAPVWQARGWPWIDPANDLLAAKFEISLGINNRQALCGERGRDFEDNLAALAEEQAMADEAGIDISGAVRRITETGPAPADASSTSATPGSAPDDGTPDDGTDSGSQANGNGASNGHRRFAALDLGELTG